MTLTRRLASLGLPILALARPALGQTQAAGYPNRPVKLVVPFPPGNMSDLIGRVLAEELQRRAGVSVVVDNRAGATGAIGIQAVTRAEPDGYTLLLSSNSPLVVNPAVTPGLPFDVLKDLVPVHLTGWTGFLLVFPPDFPADTLRDAVALMKANPGRYIAANPGSGTAGHLITVMLNRLTGMRLEQVPYRGSSQALLDLNQGRVHFMVDAMTSSLPQVRGGRAKALAVLASRRSPLIAEVPSMPETGLPELADFEVLGWTGLLAPVGTPPGVVEFWNRELNALVQDGTFKRRLAEQNVEAAPPGPPARLAELMRRELDRWTTLAREADIKVSN
jgi:tripartite-type tricarboxylate transporter receptor subunit TctC